MNRLLRRSAELSGLPVDAEWRAEIRFVNDRDMAHVNEEYLGHRGTTDVITFSYFDDPDSLFPGDTAVELLICVDTAFREGMRRKNATFAGELTLYIVHGFLHAAGENDLSKDDRQRMRRRERTVMSRLRSEFDLNQVFGFQ